MKILYKSLLIVCFLLTFILGVSLVFFFPTTFIIKENTSQVATNLDETDQALGQYAINMMYRTAAATKLSDVRKQILARSLVRTTNDIFDSFDHKKAFIAVVAIESQFQKYAQSPTGPKGLSQVAKAAFIEGLTMCGIDPSQIKDDDVWETDLNLYAGACYFRKLLEIHGDPYIAIVAYNQGPNSSDIKKFSNYGELKNQEALKYVAKFAFLKRTVTTQKENNTPDINDLPTPGNKPKNEKQ